MDKLANTGRCQVNSSPPRMMHFSDFSIDHILNRAGRLSTSQQHQQTEPVESSQFLITNVNIAKNQDGADKALSDFCQLHKPLDRDDNSILPESYRMLNWLQYTRYYPRRSQKTPSILKSNIDPVRRRTPGRLPRVPFSTGQLCSLEDAYGRSMYLSSEDADRLAERLDLSTMRVKIWFQNRRARERRECRVLKDNEDGYSDMIHNDNIHNDCRI